MRMFYKVKRKKIIEIFAWNNHAENKETRNYLHGRINGKQHRFYLLTDYLKSGEEKSKYVSDIFFASMLWDRMKEEKKPMYIIIDYEEDAGPFGAHNIEVFHEFFTDELAAKNYLRAELEEKKRNKK